MTEDTEVTFAVAAYGRDATWDVRELPESATEDLGELLAFLRRSRAEGAVVGFVCIDDDWCAILRPVPGGVKILLSDATAGLDDDLASDMLDEIGVECPTEEEADETDEPWPEGSFDLLEDLGASEQVLSVVFDDEDLYASEQVLRVAEELGCAEELADVVDLELDF